MTPGEQFVDSLPRKVRFHDRNERRSYELTRAMAAHLIDEPGSLQDGLAHARRHMASDPAQASYFKIWDQLLRKDARTVVRELLADTERGALLRDTQPVFHVLSPQLRQQIIARARADSAASTA